MKALYTLAAVLLAANVAVAATPKKKAKTTSATPAATATPAPAADTSMPAHHEAPAAAPAHHDTAVAANHSANTGSISEFHEHAMGGQLEVTPHLRYDMYTLNAQTGGGKVKINGIALGSEVEYGVMDRLSVGADLTYDTYTNKTEPAGVTPDTKIKGLEDVMLFARGSSDMGTGRLAYGLGLGLGQKAKVEANGDSNAATGGMSVKPYVGYEMMAGPGVWGAQVNYTWLGERTTDNNGTETKAKDGNTVGLATFYEYGLSDMAKIGASLSYGMVAATKDAAGTSNMDKHNDLGIGIYAPIGVATNTTIIPRLDWVSRSYSDATYPIKDASQISVGAAARLMF